MGTGPSKCSYTNYTAQMGIKDRGDPLYQVFRKGANSYKPNFIWSKDGRYSWDALGYNVDGARLKNPHKNFDYGDNDGVFQYDPVTNMIRTTGNTNKCLYAENNNNGAAIRMTTCNVNDSRQWFKIVPENG